MIDTYTAERLYPHQRADLGVWRIRRCPPDGEMPKHYYLRENGDLYHFLVDSRRKAISRNGEIYRSCMVALHRALKSEAETEAPNPGSPLAAARGCNCPVIENGFGFGAVRSDGAKRDFVRREDCPLHGAEEEA